jgi:hypothetical protein
MNYLIKQVIHIDESNFVMRVFRRHDNISNLETRSCNTSESRKEMNKMYRNTLWQSITSNLSSLSVFCSSDP